MHLLQRWFAAAAAATAAALALPAAAAGLSAATAPAVLGQPLDFIVQVRLLPGETLAPECVSAEVTVGDRRVPPPLVRAQLEATGTDTARIRVTTGWAIDEPVVGVLLNVGCESARFTRRFVVLADPPINTPAPAAAPQPSTPSFAANPADAGASVAGASTAATGEAVPARAAEAPLRGPAAALAAAPRRAPPEAAAGAAPARTEPRVAAAPRADAPRRVRRPPAATPAATLAEAPAAVSRLKLDVEAPVNRTVAATGVDEALQAVAQAASAAREAASAASASAARMAALERTVEGLRGEVNSGRDLAVQLRTRLARAEEAGRWTWPLLALVLLLTALAAWMAWRLNAAERSRQRGWQTPAGPAPMPPPTSELTPSKLPTAPIPFVNSEVHLPAAAPARGRPPPAWPAPAPAEPPPARTVAVTRPSAPAPSPQRAAERGSERTDVLDLDGAMARTEPLPPQGTLDGSAPRDVSIEELIDLEQQAEFFVVLGQDDAAIELLAEHLRNTGGGSPLPYLKLLEIYRRRGDRADYERQRTRFNQRFNAYAPEWDVDLQAGRTLDSYIGVIPRLQQVWARPLDAMAELEALLFRKSRGELFELPAYREVLFLYAVARDLLDREASGASDIDLLLPLSDGSEFSSTSPAPYLALEPGEGAAVPVAEQRPTAPLDFDLTADSGPATSIFGPLETPDRQRLR